jgi:hypothetical protein
VPASFASLRPVVPTSEILRRRRAISHYWLAGIAVVLLLGYLSRRGERESGSRQLPPAGTRPPKADIDALLRAGQKIEAIKQYRALHGVDLKTAKDAIDARARELGR